MTPILAFDIETVPDCAGIRRLHDLPADLPDRDVAEVAFQKRRAQSGGSDFLPAHLQRVIVISCVLRNDEGVRVFSIGEPDAGEAAAIQRFFDGIEQVRAAARVLERAQLRPAGAGEPRPDPRRGRRVLLGHRRRQQGFPLQQLHQPLPRAPLRPDGRAVALRRARRAARRAGAASRASRASSASAAREVWDSYRARRDRGDPQLLRGRHASTPISSTCASSSCAAPTTRERYAVRARARARACSRSAPSRTGASSCRSGRLNLRIESLDAEGRGVARNAEGKVVFVEGALPGERGRLSRSCARSPSSRSAALTKVLERRLEPADAALPAFRRLRRLQPAARRRAHADGGQAALARGEPRAHRQGGARDHAADRLRRGLALPPPRALSVRATCRRRAARWSASASGARATSPTCASATSCRRAGQRPHPAAARAGGGAVDPRAPAADRGRGRRRRHRAGLPASRCR